MQFSLLSRTLILVGLVLVGLGMLLAFAGKMNIPLGRLPGDIVYRGNQRTFYFPVITCLLLSLLGSLVLWLVNRR